MRPVTVAPSSIAGGGSVSPTRTSNVRVTGSACGATSRTRPLRRHLRVVGQTNRDHRIGGGPGAAPAPGRRTPRPDRPCGRAFAIICPACTTAPARGPTAVTTPGASASSSVKLTRSCAGLELRLGGVDLGLRGLHGFQRLIVIGARRPALIEQRVLPLEMVARLSELRLGRGERRLGGAQRVHLVLRFELGDDLTGLDLVAEPQVVFQQAAGNAEGEIDLDLRPRCGRSERSARRLRSFPPSPSAPGAAAARRPSRRPDCRPRAPAPRTARRSAGATDGPSAHCLDSCKKPQ